MNLNSVGSNDYNSQLVSQIKGSEPGKEARDTTAASAAAGSTAADTGVVYEPSADSKTAAALSSKKNGKVDTDTIAKLKADADARFSQLQGIVEKLISKQGKASENASIWSQFRQGIQDGSIQVDEETAKQAAEDVSEDGYWGVKQTSERILDFAKAISGGDSAMAEKMRSAIEKGFKEASKLWGGDLPDISQKTYDAVMQGIDDWKNEVKA